MGGVWCAVVGSRDGWTMVFGVLGYGGCWVAMVVGGGGGRGGYWVVMVMVSGEGC